jgi:hypothetical protein
VSDAGFDSLHRVATVAEEGVIPFHHVEHMFCMMPAGYDAAFYQSLQQSHC